MYIPLRVTIFITVCVVLLIVGLVGYICQNRSQKHSASKSDEN